MLLLWWWWGDGGRESGSQRFGRPVDHARDNFLVFCRKKSSRRGGGSVGGAGEFDFFDFLSLFLFLFFCLARIGSNFLFKEIDTRKVDENPVFSLLITSSLLSPSRCSPCRGLEVSHPRRVPFGFKRNSIFPPNDTTTTILHQSIPCPTPKPAAPPSSPTPKRVSPSTQPSRPSPPRLLPLLPLLPPPLARPRPNRFRPPSPGVVRA